MQCLYFFVKVWKHFLSFWTLVSSLKAANQKNGLRWVYAGAAAGIFASVVIAFALQALFPAVSSGTNREILEGFVGIFAVIMMIGIGFWLHSKSSLKSWQDYIDRKMDIVLSTGSFISMFVLSFLAVFREGAETILFYVGILPLISLQNLIIGIVSAILIFNYNCTCFNIRFFKNKNTSSVFCTYVDNLFPCI